MIIVERKGLMGHLSNLGCLEKPTRLRDVLRQMQDLGEVKVGYSHHDVDLGTGTMTSAKPLIFTLEPNSSPEKKRKLDPKKACLAKIHKSDKPACLAGLQLDLWREDGSQQAHELP